MDSLIVAAATGMRFGWAGAAMANGSREIEVHAFLGAGLLVAVLLLLHARALSVGSGIALAGVIRWGWLRVRR